ncbi:hypothetical protein GCM10023321_37660 [Pseudonocardia eucalypti]|uniref:Uncharacterized protein n=1 Tax=Pseudonocardia eucalypti TaxID=648755 RepID=A0ABP9Q850_9PSEU
MQEISPDDELVESSTEQSERPPNAAQIDDIYERGRLEAQRYAVQAFIRRFILPMETEGKTEQDQ